MLKNLITHDSRLLIIIRSLTPYLYDREPKIGII
ncbi:hypothetical protein Cal7507_0056 [Calothrix sp. PCC 7507]|nr:hypothetical protein Cal7507_0056 [Calothrix sp. PCC 7507]